MPVFTILELFANARCPALRIGNAEGWTKERSWTVGRKFTTHTTTTQEIETATLKIQNDRRETVAEGHGIPETKEAAGLCPAPSLGDNFFAEAVLGLVQVRRQSDQGWETVCRLSGYRTADGNY